MSSGTAAPKRAPRREIGERFPTDPTRAKLVEAAMEIFAERGYHAATVREICVRAGVNIASVNYHFRDKLGLYTEVLRQIASAAGHTVVREIFKRDAPPEEQLRAVILAIFQGVYSHDRPALPFRLMRHELVEATPALTQVVDEVIRPNYDRLRATVGAIAGLPPDHDTTRLCAQSIIGQIMFYPHAGPVLARLWPQLKMTRERIRQIATHVADFSLAYLHSVRSQR